MLKRMAPLLPLLMVAGCATLVPKTTSVSKITAANAVAATAEAAAVPPVNATTAHASHTVPPTAGRSGTGPFRDPSEPDAMSEIAPILEEIAVADPALHSEVLQQLGGTKPSLWSLTVQRAQQTLAYRQQLAGGTSSTPNVPTPLIASAPQPKQPSVPTSQVVQASATVAEPIKPLPPVEAPPLHVGGGDAQPPNQISNVYYTSEDRAAHQDATAIASSEPPSTPVRLASRDADTGSFDAPPSTPLELSWREHLDAAIAGMASETTETTRSPTEARERVRLNLMQLAAGKTNDAVTAAPGLSAAEQGYWSNQLYALSTMLDSERSTDRRFRADATAHHQAEASARLRSLGSLQIRNFTTCREVYGFGAYEPMNDARYAPGDSIILYAEIDNYQSEVTTDGYRTAISSSYHLVSADGSEAASGDFPEVDDLCLTRRRDFHIQYTVPLPRGLRGGEYRLELTVTDALGNKTGHDELRLTVQSR